MKFMQKVQYYLSANEISKASVSVSLYSWCVYECVSFLLDFLLEFKFHFCSYSQPFTFFTPEMSWHANA